MKKRLALLLAAVLTLQWYWQAVEARITVHLRKKVKKKKESAEIH